MKYFYYTNNYKVLFEFRNFLFYCKQLHKNAMKGFVDSCAEALVGQFTSLKEFSASLVSETPLSTDF